MNLLQIAGGQTWPNFLPILAFKPQRIWFLTSSDPDGRFANSIHHLQEAAQLAGVDIEIEQFTTTTSQPTLSDCMEALRHLQDRTPDLVNLTGGTKAMSTAAYRFACDRKIPSFHLDTRRTDQPFDDFASGILDLPFPDLGAISRQLDVRIALKAQGFPVPKTFKSPDAPHIAFAKNAAEIRNDSAASKAISTEIATLRESLSDDGGKFLKKGKLRDALRRPIRTTLGTPWHNYLLAAARHGLTQQLEPDPEFLVTTLDPETAGSDELSSQAEKTFKLLEGIWFELTVLDHLRGDESFSDIRWSVEADKSSAAASSKGETDLVAFNHKTLNLHFISCKTTGPHGAALDHIQGLRRRATKEGGEFSKAELWIHRPKSDNHRKELASHCREQNVELRVFTELPP